MLQHHAAALVMTLLLCVLNLKANNVGWLNVQVHIPKAAAHISAWTPTVDQGCQHCQYFVEATPLYVAQRPRHKKIWRIKMHPNAKKRIRKATCRNQPSFNRNQGPPDFDIMTHDYDMLWLWWFEFQNCLLCLLKLSASIRSHWMNHKFISIIFRNQWMSRECSTTAKAHTSSFT